MEHFRRVFLGTRVHFALLPIAMLVVSCTPNPRNQACTTDDVCREALGKTAYCLRSHCVECVSHATCGERKHCVDGACEWK
jgi:hypothetical protein